MFSWVSVPFLPSLKQHISTWNWHKFSCH